MQNQNTVKRRYVFEGKGLHTGKYAKMVICPAPVDTGIVFKRVDLCPSRQDLPALAEYVSQTARSTSISRKEATVMTVEHVLSALTGLGVDNAIIEINGVEVPILDGSAAPYIRSIGPDGLREQDAPRRYVEIDRVYEFRDDESGSVVRIEPADEPSYEVTIDFNSKVVGVQKAVWDSSVDYCREIGVCRTFVFFHEIEFLFKNNLIKGGDVDNAIVIVEHPVSSEQLEHMAELFNMPALEICGNGYLNNLQLHYENECARHKLLDLIGDLRLSGGFFKAKVTAVKSGHTINTNLAKQIRAAVKNDRK